MWLSTERRDVEVNRREHFEEEEVPVLRRSYSPCELRVEHSLNLSDSGTSRASLVGCQIVSVSTASLRRWVSMAQPGKPDRKFKRRRLYCMMTYSFNISHA